VASHLKAVRARSAARSLGVGGLLKNSYFYFLPALLDNSYVPF